MTITEPPVRQLDLGEDGSSFSEVCGLEEGDAYLLRLCLDLQLDAAMVALGAAAAENSGVVPELGDVVPGLGPVPWRRWFGEDVDFLCGLAASSSQGSPVLPPSLGDAVSTRGLMRILDDLIARYESMRELLVDVMSRAAGDGKPRLRPRVREALSRCQARLQELQVFRSEVHAPVPPATSKTNFLPGELLG